MDCEEPRRETLLGSFLSSLSRSRRLEDRIRQLCLEAIACADPGALDAIMERLKAALHDHASRVRHMVGSRRIERERRSRVNSAG